MRTYLVTGGAGFIGSNYIHYMFRKYGDEIRIINVDALTYAGNLENLKDIENTVSWALFSKILSWNFRSLSTRLPARWISKNGRLLQISFRWYSIR